MTTPALARCAPWRQHSGRDRRRSWVRRKHEHLLIALVAQGQVLLEGAPGPPRLSFASSASPRRGARVRPHPAPRICCRRHLGSNLFQFPDQPLSRSPAGDFPRMLLATKSTDAPKTQVPCSRQCRSGASRTTARPNALSERSWSSRHRIDREQGVYPLPSAARPVPVQAARALSQRGGRGRDRRRFGESSGPPRPSQFSIVPWHDCGTLGAAQEGGQAGHLAMNDRLQRGLVRATRDNRDLARPIASGSGIAGQTRRAPAQRSRAATTFCTTT